MKLLIIDDEPISRMLLEGMAEQWQFESVIFEDGQAAWNYMQNETQARLLLIDWEMPEMDGIELIKLIRQQKYANPPYIILLTARTETADIVEGLNSGANDYVAKPFNHAELRARIDVGYRVLEMQENLNHAQSLLSKEREVIERIITKMHSTSNFSSAKIRYLDVPVETTSGDILFSAYCPNKTQHIMLGDFTGHGLIAALGGPLASDIFYAMTSKDIAMSEIVSEINQQMCKKMPVGLFLAAIFFEVNPARNEVRVWNCGMENILLFRDQSLIQKISSMNLALGIQDSIPNEYETIDVKPDDHFYAYSDGITETNNSEGELFGEARLIQAINEMLTTGADIQALENAALSYRGNGKQLDDLTVLELRC